MPIIELENVSTFYDGEKNSTLRDISLCIQQGDFICIMGPNGSGKTTLLETINGMLPSKGRVTFMDLDVGKKGPEVRRRIGYMLQAKSFPEETPYLVKDVILMGRYGRIGTLKRPNGSDLKAAKEAADYMAVSHIWDRPVGRLSGGQTQRVLLARMLAKEPDVLLLDEPYANLDYRSVEDVASKICRRHESAGLTTLMVVHDPNHIPDICNRIVLLKSGRLIGDAPPDEMFSSREFLDAFADK